MISITNSSRILNGTDNQPIDASTSTTAIGIINKYMYTADIQTNVMMGDMPLEFWLNSTVHQEHTASYQFWLLICW